jgi:hypothetical protein
MLARDESLDDHWGLEDTQYLVRAYEDVIARAKVDGSLNSSNQGEFEYRTARYILRVAKFRAYDSKQLPDQTLSHVRNALTAQASAWASRA